MNEVHSLFKIILIGSSSVGKTNLLTRFVKNEFNSQARPTVGVDFFSKTVVVERKTVKVQIWDTAGQERFKAFSAGYYQGTHGAIIVYDITNKESFESVRTWVNELKTHLEMENLVVILIGNKSDLEGKREITEDQGRNLAEEYGFFFMETSALKNGSGEVNKAFMVIIEEIMMKTPQDKKGKGNEEQLQAGQKISTKPTSKGCC